MLTLLAYILVIIACLVPIVIWAYLFSYANHERFKITYFSNGLILGMIVAAAMIALSQIPQIFGSWNLFESFLTTGITFMNLLIILVAFVLLAVAARATFLGEFRLFAKRLLIYSPILILIVLILALSESKLATVSSTTLVLFGGYLIQAYGEEIGKFLHSLTHVEAKNSILFALFVALGFAFLENILYLGITLQQNDFAVSSVVGLFIGRSFFSIFLHAMCSFIAFFVVFEGLRSGKNNYLGIGVGILSAIAIHTLFNVTVESGKIFLIIIYMIAGYMMMGKYSYERNQRVLNGHPEYGEGS